MKGKSINRNNIINKYMNARKKVSQNKEIQTIFWGKLGDLGDEALSNPQEIIIN